MSLSFNLLGSSAKSRDSPLLCSTFADETIGRRPPRLGGKSNTMRARSTKTQFTIGLAAAMAASVLLVLSTATAETRCSKGVYVYSASWCGTCRALRSNLDRSGIRYSLLDADNPRVNADMRARFRSVAVPHMLIGRHAVRGLNTAKIQQLCR